MGGLRRHWNQPGQIHDRGKKGIKAEFDQKSFMEVISIGIDKMYKQMAMIMHMRKLSDHFQTEFRRQKGAALATELEKKYNELGLNQKWEEPCKCTEWKKFGLHCVKCNDDKRCELKKQIKYDSCVRKKAHKCECERY